MNNAGCGKRVKTKLNTKFAGNRWDNQQVTWIRVSFICGLLNFVSWWTWLKVFRWKRILKFSLEIGSSSLLRFRLKYLNKIVYTNHFISKMNCFFSGNFMLVHFLLSDWNRQFGRASANRLYRAEHFTKQVIGQCS